VASKGENEVGQADVSILWIYGPGHLPMDRLDHDGLEGMLPRRQGGTRFPSAMRTEGSNVPPAGLATATR
jgi:hypothetical protein